MGRQGPAQRAEGASASASVAALHIELLCSTEPHPPTHPPITDDGVCAHRAAGLAARSGGGGAINRRPHRRAPGGKGGGAMHLNHAHARGAAVILIQCQPEIGPSAPTARGARAAWHDRRRGERKAEAGQGRACLFGGIAGMDACNAPMAGVASRRCHCRRLCVCADASRAAATRGRGCGRGREQRSASVSRWRRGPR